MQIIPSILVQNENQFIEQITAVQDSVSLVQFDIADGKFVPQTTWADPDMVEKIAKIDIELHLMVHNPLHELDRWTATEQIKRVLIHYESLNIQSPLEEGKGVLSYAHEQGWQVGFVLNPDTPITVLEPYLSDLDLVMFMGVNPGLQGQQFIPDVLQKMTEFCSRYPHVPTSVDGGVNESTLPDIITTGVQAICPGSAIFGNGKNPTKNIEKMREIINRLT